MFDVPMDKLCRRSFVLTSIIAVGDKVCKPNTCKQLQDIADVHQLPESTQGFVYIRSTESLLAMPINDAMRFGSSPTFATHCQDAPPQLPRTNSLFQVNPDDFATPQLDDTNQMLKLPRYLPFQRELEHDRPLPRKLLKTILSTKRTTGPIPRLTNTDGTHRAIPASRRRNFRLPLLPH